MTSRDFEWFWANLLIPSERESSAAVCRIILDVADNRPPAARIAERLENSIAERQIPRMMQIMIGLADVVPRDVWPTLLIIPPNPSDAAIWLVGAVHSLEQLIAALPAMPAAIVVENSAFQAAMRIGSQPHALAVLREGFVQVRALDEAELADRLRDAGMTAGHAATARRLACEGASEELAAAFSEAVRRAGRTDTPEEEEAARSAAEKFLFERLESLAATAGLFALNQQLEFRHGHTPAEVDLLAPSLRLAIELDGSYFHLRDAVSYRRDRRKDWELQQHDYLVLRFLSDDVVERLEEILNTILATVELRRACQPKRGCH
ncbi:MAG TPA: DUF559 domain-containing protein [Gemmataceae bacterium]|nr:DUF559 domain-containing protein [Gemmataceae bacterium]